VTVLDAVAQLPAPGLAFWEITKGVLLTLCTVGILAALRLLWKMRDAIQKLTHVVFGTEGKNGLFASAALYDLRLDSLEGWRTRLDAVSEIEHELWEGAERRHRIRRLRDRVMTDVPLKKPDE
jgi:hypothetical protein